MPIIMPAPRENTDIMMEFYTHHMYQIIIQDYPIQGNCYLIRYHQSNIIVC